MSVERGKYRTFGIAILDAPPYSPAVTSARIADNVSRAMTFLPTVACIGTSNSCRGITLSNASPVSRQCPMIEGAVERVRTQFLYPGSPNLLLRRLMHNEG